jgi:nicotinic acid mononucleotide adenylyltransferase
VVVASDGSRSRIRRTIFQDEIMKAVLENEVVNIIENEELAGKIESNFLKFHHENGGLTFGVLKLSPQKFFGTASLISPNISSTKITLRIASNSLCWIILATGIL